MSPAMGLFNRWFSGRISPGLDQPVEVESPIALSNPIGSVARASINRIVSRASHVRFKGDEGSRQNKPGGAGGSSRDFYSDFIEQMLIEGYALAYPNSKGDFRVAISEGSNYNVEDDSWDLKAGIGPTLARMVRVPNKEVLFATLRPLRGNEIYLPDQPMREIADAMILYERGRQHQVDYSDRGNRVGFVVKANKDVTNPDKQKNLLNDIQKFLNASRRQYGVMRMPLESDLLHLPGANAPAKGSIEYATQEIARFYGVPLQMLQTDAAATADEERVESRLLTDAVFPTLDRVCIAWEKKLMRPVTYDGISLSRPTLGARAAHIKNLAQAGIFTVNEIRGMMGYEPLPGPEGDRIASPAGGPDHEKEPGRPRGEE